MASFYKRTVSLFILCAFMLQALYSPFLILDYYLNTASYKKSCINKAKAWLHCNGQCQLMKKILEQEKREKQNPDIKFAAKTEIISYNSFIALYKPEFFSAGTIEFSPGNSGTPVDNATSLFRPPNA